MYLLEKNSEKPVIYGLVIIPLELLTPANFWYLNGNMISQGPTRSAQGNEQVKWREFNSGK